MPEQVTWTGKGQGWGLKPKGPPPSQDDPFYTSASQIDTFRDCQRKWAFDKIDRIPRAQNPYASLGTYIHERLQEYLEIGKLPEGEGIAISIVKKSGEVRDFTHNEIMAIMLPGLKHLPEPGVAKCEGRFEIDLGVLGKLVGYIDFLYEDGIPIVGDHKTTSGLQWAKTPEDLTTDPQCVIYTVFALERFRADEAQCRWVYYQTNKPKAKKVELKRSLTEIAKPWENILRDIEGMKRFRDSGAKAAQAEYNVGACEKYGGCPYLTVCPLTPADRLRSYHTMLNLKERMAQRSKATPELAPATVAETTPAPVKAVPTEGAGQAINPPEGASALAALKAKATKSAPPEPEAKPTVVNNVVPETKPDPAQQQWEAAGGKGTALEGFTLYIDCAPNRECIDFPTLIKPALDEIQAEKGCHYRLIPDLFGGNGALLAEVFSAHLDANPPTGDVMVTLSSPVVRDVIEVLQERASLVVRGF